MSTATAPTVPDRSVGPLAPPTAAAPWWGRPWEWRHATLALFGALAAALAYRQATLVFAPAFAPGALEFWGTTTSLWCVWITQRRNVLSLPIGIVSVLLMGTFFFQIDLVGQGWLHWGYYLPIQVWAWRQWTRGGAGGVELDVRHLGARARLGVLGALLAGTALVTVLLDAGYHTALYVSWDASIVAASVIAQVLLSIKRTESWWLWILPVNVSAIGLYTLTGAYMFAALYCLFLVMAFFGLARWRAAAAAGAA